jgi:ribonuclease D
LYTSTPHFVRTPEDLVVALRQLAQSPFVAIDTEFLREKTYYPKFCLLQMAHDNYCALIDVLQLPSLQPILDFLNDRNRLKVLHAAHQDLEVLALANAAATGVSIKPIAGPFFDTQVAAAFLDMPANIGYAELVQRRLHLTLDKGQSRTDWSKRPLSEEQLVYAAADVIHLAELYHLLRDALERSGRLAWLEEEAARLENPGLYATEPSEAWQRLRGLEHMAPEARAVAKALAGWRERRAMQKDLPRSWVLADDALRQVAERLPATLDELASVNTLSRGTVERRGEELLKLIAEARQNGVHEKPASDFRPSTAQQKVVRNLMEYVRKQGAQLRVSPEYLATRRAIEGLVFSGTIGAFGHGWRFQSFGEQLIKAADEERARL